MEAFRFLCRCLSRSSSAADDEGQFERISLRNADWQQTLLLSNRHMVTPALYVELKNKNLIASTPSDAVDFLSHVYEANRARNTHLKKQTLGVIRCLNESGIVPLILKGGTHLFGASKPAFGRRMMSDIDLLVRENCVDSALAVLSEEGYEEVEGNGSWTIHERALFREDQIAPIEIHRSVGMQRTLLSVEEAFAEATKIDEPNIDAVELSPTHKIFFNVFHAQIQDRGHLRGVLPLKDLYDFSQIVHEKQDLIDWNFVCSAFRKGGSTDALEAYAGATNLLLRTPVPVRLIGGMRSKWNLKRNLYQIRFPKLATMVQLFAGVTAPVRRSYVEYLHNCEIGRAHV